MTLIATPKTRPAEDHGRNADTRSAAAAGPLRWSQPPGDGRLFWDYLNDQVDAHIAALIAAHAVDEANGDVLDALIDWAVAQQQAAAERELLHQTTELRRREQTAAVRKAAADSEFAACKAEQAAHAARVLALRQRLLGEPDTAHADAPVNTGLQRAFIEKERKHWQDALQAALRSVRLRDASRLPAAAAAAQRRADATGEVLADTQGRAEAAQTDLAEALAGLRGTGHRISGGTPLEHLGGAR